MQTAASFPRVPWRRGVWGEDTCAAVRYDMLSFCHRADICHRARNFQVLWQSDGYESHFHRRDMHFGHSLVFQGEWVNYPRVGFANFSVFLFKC